MGWTLPNLTWRKCTIDVIEVLEVSYSGIRGRVWVIFGSHMPGSCVFAAGGVRAWAEKERNSLMQSAMQSLQKCDITVGSLMPGIYSHFKVSGHICALHTAIGGMWFKYWNQELTWIPMAIITWDSAVPALWSREWLQCANGARNPETSVCFAAGGEQRVAASPYISIVFVAQSRCYYCEILIVQ